MTAGTLGNPGGSQGAAADGALFEARVRTAVAPMHAEPTVTSQCTSQQLSGHTVSVLAEQGDWLWVRGADEYEGWMHRGFLARAPRSQARRSQETGWISLGCVARSASGKRALPLRALLAPEERVASGEAIKTPDLPRWFQRDGSAIAQTAQQYFHGTSYSWGGVTPWGADCSGMVSSVFALHGIQLPRDAWQQAEAGWDAGQDIGKLQPGQLLFFSDRDDGRITHVGIALGKRRMVHLALGRGGFAVERMDAKNDPFVAMLRERFRCARAIL